MSDPVDDRLNAIERGLRAEVEECYEATTAGRAGDERHTDPIERRHRIVAIP